MILACSNITKTFDGNTIIDSGSFHIEDKEKAAIVGINGAGKSTLLKIIIGELASDNGEVVISKDKTLGYLAQYQDDNSEMTIYEEMLEVKKDIIEMEKRIRDIELEMKTATGEKLEKLLSTYTRLNHKFEYENGYAYKSEITGVLKGLGFMEDEFDKKVGNLSGGQKTRVSLGRLLLSKPDIILLDEPTNHLDMSSISWLETFLSNYQGSVIIVAHDRYFLDRVVSKVVEIDNGKVTSFTGNYSAYAEKKAMLRDAEIKTYYNQQKEIKHQEEVITKLRSFNREKSIRRADSREKMLDKIEVMDKPITDVSSMNIKLEPKIVSGNDVLIVKELSKAFDSHELFENVSFEVKRGERVAIIGDNGTGKTTILKIINGLIKPSSGEIKLGAKVKIGYYDQEHHVLDMNKTLFNEISDAYPTLTNTEIRNVLAAFLFTGDDVFKLIGDLSGGEKGRVSLAKLMLSESNFLILDEPTNHLDIMSKEILENALNQYTGTVLYVSHDRYFINKTATRIVELTHHNIINFEGNYDYYLEKRDTLLDINFGQSSDDENLTKEDTSEVKVDWKQQKEEQAKARKLQNAISKNEARIAELEQIVANCDEEMCKSEVASDTAKLLEIHKKQEAANEELLVLYDEWESLMENQN